MVSQEVDNKVVIVDLHLRSRTSLLTHLESARSRSLDGPMLLSKSVA